jgi:LytS/YehU family sensor histidine kinase
LKTIEVALIAALVALCVATNYALIGVHQVKAMDFIVFVGGFCYGPLIGALTGFLSWTIYGVLNPFGFVPQIWFATMIMESIYGLVGGFLGRNFVKTSFREQRLPLGAFFSIMGFILTLIYDLVVSSVYASVFNVPLLVAVVVGTPFHVLHELSNAVIFGIASIPFLSVMRKLRSARGIVFSKK